MRLCQLVWAVVLAAGGWPGGCSRPPKEPSPADPEPTIPATEAECRAVAVELERAVRSRDPAQAIQAFALEVVAHRVVEELPGSEKLKSEIFQLLPNRADTNEMVNQVVTEVANGGQFKLLRVSEVDGRHVATFRLSRADFGAVYLNMLVARFPGGRVGVEEIVRLNDGDRLTDMVWRAILPAATLRDRGLLARLTERDQLLVAHTKKVEELCDASQADNWRGVIAAYKALPAGLQEDKPFLCRYARACIRLGGPDAVTAMDQCRRMFVGDPAVDLLALDYHFYRREYAATGRTADSIQVWLGDDAQLDVLRALSLAKMGKLKAARVKAEDAVAGDPELRLAYACRIDIALQEQNDADTLAWLKKAIEKTGQDYGDLRRLSAFAAFVESPEFRQWLAWRATRRER